MATLVEVQGDGNGDQDAGANAAAVENGGSDGAESGAGVGSVSAEVGDRPEFIPESAWTDKGYDKNLHLEALRAEFRPESADAYTLPDIEGFDKDKAATSPLVVALRQSAHAAGLDQGGFEAALKTYTDESVRLANEAATEAKTKLGDNADARLNAVGVWLGANLPRAEADALAAGLTSAEAVIAFEKIMKSGGRQASSETPAATSRKSRAEIEQMMGSKEYMGKASERNQKVIDEVDAWFKAEASAKAAGK